MSQPRRLLPVSEIVSVLELLREHDVQFTDIHIGKDCIRFSRSQPEQPVLGVGVSEPPPTHDQEAKAAYDRWKQKTKQRA